MIDVGSMDKLLAPDGTSMTSFDKILAPGGTAVESDYQLANRKDGSGRDCSESGGGDFDASDRATASTERGQDQQTLIHNRLDSFVHLGKKGESFTWFPLFPYISCIVSLERGAV